MLCAHQLSLLETLPILSHLTILTAKRIKMGCNHFKYFTSSSEFYFLDHLIKPEKIFEHSRKATALWIIKCHDSEPFFCVRIYFLVFQNKTRNLQLKTPAKIATSLGWAIISWALSVESDHTLTSGNSFRSSKYAWHLGMKLYKNNLNKNKLHHLPMKWNLLLHPPEDLWVMTKHSTGSFLFSASKQNKQDRLSEQEKESCNSNSGLKVWMLFYIQLLHELKKLKSPLITKIAPWLESHIIPF